MKLAEEKYDLEYGLFVLDGGGDGHNCHRIGYYRFWDPLCPKGLSKDGSIDLLPHMIQDKYEEFI